MSTTESAALSPKDLIKGAHLQRRRHRINLAGHLVADLERLDEELHAIVNTEESGPPKRLTSKSGTAAKIAEIDALRAEMENYWLDLVLEQKPRDEWQAFKAANPPRDDSSVDEQARCNFDELVNTFSPTCVVEPTLDAEDWAGIFAKAAAGDLDNLGLKVFAMHERGLDVPKSLLASAVKRKNVDASK